MKAVSLDEFEEIAAAAHLTATKTVVCPPDIHRFEVYGTSGCLETEKVGCPHFGAFARGGAGGSGVAGAFFFLRSCRAFLADAGRA